MKSSVVWLMLFLSISCIDGNEINCEAIRRGTWLSLQNATLKTCLLQTFIRIDAANKKVSNSDVSVRAISFFKNSYIFYLPIDVSKSFPNLVAYEASETSINEISKVNFKNLRKLLFLDLSYNTIETIFSDTFEDLVELEILRLGECG